LTVGSQNEIVRIIIIAAVNDSFQDHKPSLQFAPVLFVAVYISNIRQWGSVENIWQMP